MSLMSFPETQTSARFQSLIPIVQAPGLRLPLLAVCHTCSASEGGSRDSPRRKALEVFVCLSPALVHPAPCESCSDSMHGKFQYKIYSYKKNTSCKIKTPFPVGHGLIVNPSQECSRNCHSDGSWTPRGVLLPPAWAGNHCFHSLFFCTT